MTDALLLIVIVGLLALGLGLVWHETLAAFRLATISAGEQLSPPTPPRGKR